MAAGGMLSLIFADNTRNKRGSRKKISKEEIAAKIRKKWQKLCQAFLVFIY